MNKLENFIQKNRLIISISIFIILFLLTNLTRLSVNNYFPSAQSTVFTNDFQDYKSFSYEGTNAFYESVIELSFLFGEEASIFVVIFS